MRNLAELEASTMESVISADSRRTRLQRAVRLEVLTVGWNVVEGGVAIAAAVAAGSVALFGFGVDSFVECASGAILLWRLSAEQRGLAEDATERLDRRAHRLVGASLFLLAAWVAFDATRSLWAGDRSDASPVGIALTAVSIVTMLWLARAKRRAAAALGSRALEADAFQTTACFWLSVITLAGVGLNALFGWWWADPVAALAMTGFIGKEGLEAWKGEDCGCAGEPLRSAGKEPTAGCGCSAGRCGDAAPRQEGVARP
jgi:divalent metal cation (Fe/Co/Zn/Cd) transporter